MPEIKFIARLKEIPPLKTQILRLAPPSVNEKTLYEFSRRLGLKGTRAAGILGQDADALTYAEGTNIVQVFRASGGIRFQDHTRWQVDDGKSEVKYKDDEAINMARGKIEQTGLVPLNECKLMKVSHLRAGSLGKSGDNFEERTIDTGIVFQRIIDNVPVNGPGGRVVVYLDHDGEMTGFDCIWRKVQEVYKPVQRLQTPQYAEEKLSQFYQQSKFRRIEVKEARLGYFELGWRDTQRFLQPAYVMPVTMFSKDERLVMKSAFVIEAASNPVGTLAAKLKAVRVQPARKD
jgi:hypothetical protein